MFSFLWFFDSLFLISRNKDDSGYRGSCVLDFRQKKFFLRDVIVSMKKGKRKYMQLTRRLMLFQKASCVVNAHRRVVVVLVVFTTIFVGRKSVGETRFTQQIILFFRKILL